LIIVFKQEPKTKIDMNRNSNLTALALGLLTANLAVFLLMQCSESKKDGDKKAFVMVDYLHPYMSPVGSEPPPPPAPPKPKRTLRFVVERVFAGTPSSYSLMYKDGEKVVIESLTTIVEKKTGIKCDWVGFNVTFEEVEEDKPMEAIMTTNDSDPGGWGKWIWDVKIHIHNPKDVGAGTWQYKKKSGRTTTTATGHAEVIQ
jgi:hypothetical protein